jgi:hypothetical protein
MWCELEQQCFSPLADGVQAVSSARCRARPSQVIIESECRSHPTPLLRASLPPPMHALSLPRFAAIAASRSSARIRLCIFSSGSYGSLCSLTRKQHEEGRQASAWSVHRTYCSLVGAPSPCRAMVPAALHLALLRGADAASGRLGVLPEAVLGAAGDILQVRHAASALSAATLSLLAPVV